MEYLNEAGIVAAKTTFVLNNSFGREILKLRDVEQALGTQVAGELPYDPFLYLKAVNEGVPDRPRRAALAGGRATRQAVEHRVRRGRDRRAAGGGRRPQVGRPLRVPPPLTGSGSTA